MVSTAVIPLATLGGGPREHGGVSTPEAPRRGRLGLLDFFVERDLQTVVKEAINRFKYNVS